MKTEFDRICLDDVLPNINQEEAAVKQSEFSEFGVAWIVDGALWIGGICVDRCRPEKIMWTVGAVRHERVAGLNGEKIDRFDVGRAVLRRITDTSGSIWWDICGPPLPRVIGGVSAREIEKIKLMRCSVF